jgi:hypothetical protein
MTNKELQEYLKQFPDDATIETLSVYHGYYGLESMWEYLDPKEHLQCDDYRVETAPEDLENKVFIRIGSSRY